MSSDVKKEAARCYNKFCLNRVEHEGDFCERCQSLKELNMPTEPPIDIERVKRELDELAQKLDGWSMANLSNANCNQDTPESMNTEDSL